MLLLLAVPQAAAQEPGNQREAEPFVVKGVTYDLDQGLLAGPIHIHAYLSEFISYDSNPFLKSSKPDYDFIFDTLLGMRGDMFLGDNLVSLFFDAEYANAAYDNDFDKVNYSGGGRGSLNLKDFFLDVKAAWSEVTEPETVRISDWDEIRRQTLECSLETGLRMGRLGVEAGGYFWLRRFGGGYSKTVLMGDGNILELSRDYLNHYEAVGHIRIAYIWARLRVFVAASAGVVQFTDDVMHDYSYFSFVAGASLKVTKKIDGEATAGYSFQNVQGMGRARTIQDDSEFSGFVGSLALKYFFSEKLRTTLQFISALQFSGSSNYQIYDSLRASATHQLFEKLSWTLEFGIDYIDPSANYNYAVYRGSFDTEYRIFDWASAGMKFEFRKRDTHRVVSGGKSTSLNYNDFIGSLVLTVFF